MKMSALKGIGWSLAVALTATAVHAQDPIEVRLSFNQAASSPAWQEAMGPYADRLETLSEGRLSVQRYPGEVLHSVGDGFRAAATGITDVTSAWPVYSASSFDLFHATELPRALPASDVAAVRVLDEIYAEYLRPEYEHMGIYLAFNAVTPEYDILTTTPVNSIDDLQGLRIRAAGGGISEIVERLGATPVTMTITDAYTAFQQGVVDGIILSTADMVAYRMHEVGEYNYRIGVVRVSIPHAINRDFYEQLPDDLKEVFAAAGTEAAYDYQQMYARLTAQAIETMEEEGVTIVQASDEDLARADELLAPMWDDFIATNGGEGSVAESLVADLQALTEKYGAMTDEEILELRHSDPVSGLRP